MSTTPNMTLVLPVVSTTIGPTWATNLNTALELVDAHDHSSAKGVKITPAGMNINATLEINSQDITEVNSLSLDTRASAPSTLRALYSKSGDLYFKNTAGTEVQVTNGGTIAGTPGSITNLGDGGSSAVFSDINEDFTWYFDGVKPAAMNMGDIRLYPFDGSAAYTNFVTLKSPTSLASSYSVTMPGTAPAQSGVWSVNTSGVIQNGLHDGTALAPSLYFNGDADLGLYRVGENQLGMIGQLQLPVGSAGTPSWAFVGDENTGMYNVGADSLGITVGGTLRRTITSSVETITLPQRAHNGSAASPSYSFTGDTDTGFYWSQADNIGVAANGLIAAQLGSSGIYGLGGSGGGPSFSFMNDPDTGIYREGNNSLGFSAGGARGTITSSGLSITDGIASGGGGYLKWTVYSGTLASGTSTTLTPGGTIVGATGWSSYNGGAVWGLMSDDGTNGAAMKCSFAPFTGTSTEVDIRNGDTDSSNDYKVTVFYQ